MHQSFSGQLGQCSQNDRDKGEGGIGEKQLKTEFSNLSRCSDVVAHESEDGNEAHGFSPTGVVKPGDRKYHQQHKCIYRKKYSVLSVLPYRRLGLLSACAYKSER